MYLKKIILSTLAAALVVPAAQAAEVTLLKQSHGGASKTSNGR